MNTDECEALYLEIQQFYKDLILKLKQQIPMQLVDTQALYEGIAGEENGHRCQPEATGYRILEEHTGGTILRRSKRPRC